MYNKPYIFKVILSGVVKKDRVFFILALDINDALEWGNKLCDKLRSSHETNGGGLFSVTSISGMGLLSEMTEGASKRMEEITR